MTSRDFLLPDLGEGLEEAEVVSWSVAEGDRVELNQPLAELETAKAVVEIPSPFAGLVTKLHASEGEVVLVGAPLVTFELEDAAGDDAAAPSGNGEAPPKRQAVLVGYGPPPEEEPRGTTGSIGGAAQAETARVRATPPVRKLARDLGVDLSGVRGTGPKGRVTREDVEAAAAAASAAESPQPDLAPAPAAGDERVPVRGVRRAVAEHMARAWRDIPHVTTFLTVDFTQVQAFRTEIQAASPGVKIRPLAVVARALVEVVRDHPVLSSSWDPEHGQIVLRSTVHLGIATDTQDGLLVPVVHDAASLGITALATAISEVSEAARNRTATLQQLTGSTITITNVGSFGSEYGTPIINAPEAAILSIGVIEPRALVIEGEIVARPAAVLGLTFDHRVMDGAQAGRALRELADLLESPFRLGALPR